MWQLLSTGTAEWRFGGRSWTVAAPGGAPGITIGQTGDPQLVHLDPVGDAPLPILADQFIRGDEWHLSFPQQQGPYGLSLACRPVHTEGRRLVLELTIAIETTLLDSHPTLDLRAEGDGYRSVTPEVESIPGADPRGGAGGITEVMVGDTSVAVLLGPRDFPWTLDLSDDRQICLRLFGEFLEKGVIRKARPWIVLDREPGAGDDAGLVRWWEELCRSPLPLMS